MADELLGVPDGGKEDGPPGVLPTPPGDKKKKKKKGKGGGGLPDDPFDGGDKVPGGKPGQDGGGGGGFGGGSGGDFQPTLMKARFLGQQSYIQQITDLYVQIWGTAPPPGYVEGMMKRGLNLYEVLDRERRKPAFRFTRFYRDSQFRVAGAVAEWFGSS